MKSKEERKAAWKATARNAHRDVFETEHPDPFDPLFKFPEWVPGFFVKLHRRCLRKLLKKYKPDQIAVEYGNYKTRLTSDHAKGRDIGPLYSVTIVPVLTDEFRDLAHIVWALDISESEGQKAALQALLGDPDEVRFWHQGRMNVEAVRKGGIEKGRHIKVLNLKKADEFKEQILEYKRRHQSSNFTAACNHLAKYHHCSPSWVRTLLTLAGIPTAASYKEINQTRR
jgi:hypothetical protein